MRRIRTGEPGAHVIVEAGRRRLGLGVTIESSGQIAAIADVRSLLDLLRMRLGDALRGKSTPELEPTWELTPIYGGPLGATTEITLTNRTASRYLAQVFAHTEAAVVPPLIAQWIAAAVPASGDGVSLPAEINTGGGPLPR